VDFLIGGLVFNLLVDLEVVGSFFVEGSELVNSYKLERVSFGTPFIEDDLVFALAYLGEGSKGGKGGETLIPED